MHSDTIAGIATAVAAAGVGIVRLSGGDAIEITRGLFSGNTEFLSHTITYGQILRGTQVIDEVLVSVMRGPRSYTKEDVVEINCHGGSACIRGVLEAVLEAGARLAEPGEFTKRAFINGRIDLSQAEAVRELIDAKTGLARAAAVARLAGGLGKAVTAFREGLLSLIASIEASIDYPEHDMEHLNLCQIREQGGGILAGLEGLIKTAEGGRILKDGIETVIIGRPNVGKSSLLNALLKEERAIVTDIPGTTRDVLYEYVDIGLPLRLVDTAGLRETADVIERIGVRKTREALESAELVLFVVDGSEELTAGDLEIFELLENKPVIILSNKSDLTQKADLSALGGALNISAASGEGLEALCGAIKEMFSDSFGREGEVLISDARQKAALVSAAECVKSALNAIELGLTEDLVSVDLQAAYGHLGEITGENVGEDVIDRIFSQFCLGK